jgi:hypothetical protein
VQLQTMAADSATAACCAALEVHTRKYMAHQLVTATRLTPQPAHAIVRKLPSTVVTLRTEWNTHSQGQQMGPTRASHDWGAAVRFRGTPHIYTRSSSTESAQNASHVRMSTSKDRYIDATAGMSALFIGLQHIITVPQVTAHTQRMQCLTVSVLSLAITLLLSTRVVLRGQRHHTNIMLFDRGRSPARPF